MSVLLAASSCSDKEKINTARLEVKLMRAAVDAFQTKNGRYPDTLGELEMAKLATVKPDPWGNAYVLRFEHDKPVVLSLGADGELGGTSSNADIRSQ